MIILKLTFAVPNFPRKINLPDDFLAVANLIPLRPPDPCVDQKHLKTEFKWHLLTTGNPVQPFGDIKITAAKKNDIDIFKKNIYNYRPDY